MTKLASPHPPSCRFCLFQFVCLWTWLQWNNRWRSSLYYHDSPISEDCTIVSGQHFIDHRWDDLSVNFMLQIDCENIWDSPAHEPVASYWILTCCELIPKARSNVYFFVVLDSSICFAIISRVPATSMISFERINFSRLLVGLRIVRNWKSCLLYPMQLRKFDWNYLTRT